MNIELSTTELLNYSNAMRMGDNRQYLRQLLSDEQLLRHFSP
jgi:hypothetical protein